MTNDWKIAFVFVFGYFVAPLCRLSKHVLDLRRCMGLGGRAGLRGPDHPTQRDGALSPILPTVTQKHE